MSLLEMTDASRSTAIWDLCRVDRRKVICMLLAVNRGARQLDEIEPGWWARITSNRLAMDSCDRCVMGQLYGGYVEGLRVLLPARLAHPLQLPPISA